MNDELDKHRRTELYEIPTGSSDALMTSVLCGHAIAIPHGDDGKWNTYVNVWGPVTDTECEADNE